MLKNKTCFIVIMLVIIASASAQVDTVWTRRYTSAGAVADYAYIMTIDSVGNVYVAGHHTITNQSSNALVKKYDTNGNLLWTYEYNSGNYAERFSSIAVARSGNVYLCGYTMGYNAGDYLIVKLNGQTGDSIWTRTYDAPGSGGYDFARRIAIDALENLYVTGYGARSGYGTSDIVTVKYNADGVLQWEAFYDAGVTGADQGYSIFVNETGVYVTGSSNATSSGNPDIVTIKYDPATGNAIWSKRYNGTADGNDYGRDIVADALGNVYITGSASNTGTSTDITTIKYNSSGDTLWLRIYNGPDNLGDAGWWIKVDGSGNVYVYGISNYTSNGQDLCLVKYDAVTGNELWVQTYNGPALVGSQPSYENCPDETGQNGMELDASGNIYLTGRSTFVGAPLTSYTDILTLKYNSSGELQWEARYNHPDIDTIHQGQSVAVDNANNVYVAGYGRGSGTYIDWVTIKYTQGAPSYYTITATAYGGGSIIPSGNVMVMPGSDTTFVISPNIGYHLDSLVVDAVNHGSDSTSYRFVNVTSNHTISAYFSINTYLISATATAGGTITPSGDVIIAYGHDTTFVIAPNTNYQIDSVMVDGVSVGVVTEYTF
ncbi:MAG: SBBP repeat-containing protein, partial [candidate division WOR-3 bacterium]